jgi:hypothetical protein
LIVGTAGQALDGTLLAATPNAFWDEHAIASSSSLLDYYGATSCKIVCNQQYSCNSTQLGAFTLTFNFTKGTINGTPVTNVTVTKQ